MLTQILWWAGDLLIALLLIRSLQGRFLKKYPVFYSYLVWILFSSLLSHYVYGFHPGAYQVFYWYKEFVSVSLGYCIIWEIYAQALAEYPGASRMARTVVSVSFVLALASVIAHMFNNSIWSLAETTAVLERNWRTPQAVLLIGIVGLLAYYAIPIGRNLKGLILGYGFVVGTSIINLTLRAHFGKAFQPWWHYLGPLAYIGSLFMWTVALWTYHPNPRPKAEVTLERDYELISVQTARALARARHALLRAVRT